MATIEPRKRSVFQKSDIAALLVFFCLAGFLVLSIRYAEPINDEYFYYATAQRFLAGDRFLVDEWHVSQLSALFLMLPYEIFIAATGGTAGIVLFMRRVFVAADLLLYWFFYGKLRKLTPAASVAAGFFCADFFAGVPAFSYYTMALQGVAVGILLLFSDGKEPRAAAVLSGAVFACAVLNQPSLALLYAVFSAAALIRGVLKKRNKNVLAQYEFFLSGRIWLRITAGICLLAAAFAVLLGVVSGWKNVFAGLPELFTDSRHGFAWYGNPANAGKISILISNFGALPCAALLALIPASLLIRKTGGKKIPKLVALLLSQLLFTVSAAKAMKEGRDDLFRCSGFPILILAVIDYILCERRDRRLLIFLAAAAGCSAAVDYVSDITVCYGGRLAYFPAVCCLAEVIRELCDAFGVPARGIRRALSVRAVPLLLAALMLLTQARHVFVSTDYFLPRKLGSLGVTAEFGPDKGLVKNRDMYLASVRTKADLDAVAAGCKGPFYTVSLSPSYYLYLDKLPIGTYSTYYVEEDGEKRTLRYWLLHPEKRPECVYIPFDAERKHPGRLAFFDRICDYEITRGKNGYILRVTGWK